MEIQFVCFDWRKTKPYISVRAANFRVIEKGGFPHAEQKLHAHNYFFWLHCIAMNVLWITASDYFNWEFTSHANTFLFMWERSANIIGFNLFNLWQNVEHFPFTKFVILKWKFVFFWPVCCIAEIVLLSALSQFTGKLFLETQNMWKLFRMKSFFSGKIFTKFFCATRS